MVRAIWGSQKILVVDDDQQILNLVARSLQELGCEILLAHDGHEGLQRFLEERPPLVVSDLLMPKIDGLTLMKAIKEASPTTEVLIVTAHADLSSAIEAVRQGAFDYLTKPFDVETLRLRVNRALERHRLVSEKETLLKELEARVQARTAALVESQRQLRNSEKLTAVSHLAAGLAHELGNALGIIGGSVQVLLGKGGECWREGREYLEAIHRNVAAADRTIRDLLDFARPREPCWKVMDVTEPLDRVRLLLKGEFAKRGVEVVTRYAPGPLRIQGDQEQLEHVFLNLLLNAMQAMEAGGTITLAAVSDPPQWIRVDVTDTGRGIPREHLDQIFDPFFTTRGMGTGLGLSIVHRYVDAHHGRLTIESQEGKGTRVTVFLSAMAPALVRDRG